MRWLQEARARRGRGIGLKGAKMEVDGESIFCYFFNSRESRVHEVPINQLLSSPYFLVSLNPNLLTILKPLPKYTAKPRFRDPLPPIFPINPRLSSLQPNPSTPLVLAPFNHLTNSSQSPS